jgi:hypothetical protein
MRKWDFRGISDNGPIQHPDMVLGDEKVKQVHTDHFLINVQLCYNAAFIMLTIRSLLTFC